MPGWSMVKDSLDGRKDVDCGGVDYAGWPCPNKWVKWHGDAQAFMCLGPGRHFELATKAYKEMRERERAERAGLADPPREPRLRFRRGPGERPAPRG